MTPKKYNFINLDQSQLYDYKKRVDEYMQKLSSERKRFRNVCCVNCGERGHVVKDCSAPITSFGIIAFKVVNTSMDEMHDKNSYLTDIITSVKKKQKWKLNFHNNLTHYPLVKFLMIQRKDTMGYIDFIRGKYPNNEKDRYNLIKTCLNEMTKTEKNNLLTKSFDQLWSDLWVNHASNTFKNEYENAKYKYSQLNVVELVNNSNNHYDFQEFSFPKGRREMKETNIACAEREFFEETGYSKDTYEFLKNYPTIQEDFVGTNGITYRHIYYVVKMKDKVSPPLVDKNSLIQTGEVKNIGWFTVDECMSIIRPYDTAKKDVLRKVYNDLLNMNNCYDCSNYYHGVRRSLYKRPIQRSFV